MIRMFIVGVTAALLLASCGGPDRARVDLDTGTSHARDIVCTYEVWTVTTEKDGFRYLVVDVDPHNATTLKPKDRRSLDAFLAYEAQVPSYGATMTGPLRELGLHQFQSLTNGKVIDADIVEHYDAFDAATNSFHGFCGSPG
jgi:hypothetical protein